LTEDGAEPGANPKAAAAAKARATGTKASRRRRAGRAMALSSPSRSDRATHGRQERMGTTGTRRPGRPEL